MESLIVNVDFCGTCRGTCPTCVLTKDERLTNAPLTTPDLVISALMDIKNKYGSQHESFIFGFGRGNHLVLPEYTVEQMMEIMDFIHENFDAHEYLIEVSTSLVGKIIPQIERAKLIIDKISDRYHKFDIRYVVVANVGVSSPKYWENVFLFLNELKQHRGGDYDGNGDIVQVNLSIDNLPDLDWFESYFKDFSSPLNIAWVPSFDSNTGNKKFMDDFENWMLRFYEISISNNLDTNIINWALRSIKFNNFSLNELIDNALHSSKSLLYIDPYGVYHNGYPTIMADMDPVRFDPFAATLNNSERKSTLHNNGKDILNLLRNKSCRQCKYISTCYHSGGYRISLISMRYNENNEPMCLNGLRKTFERIEENV